MTKSGLWQFLTWGTKKCALCELHVNPIRRVFSNPVTYCYYEGVNQYWKARVHGGTGIMGAPLPLLSVGQTHLNQIGANHQMEGWALPTICGVLAGAGSTHQIQWISPPCFFTVYAPVLRNGYPSKAYPCRDHSGCSSQEAYEHKNIIVLVGNSSDHISKAKKVEICIYSSIWNPHVQSSMLISSSKIVMPQVGY